MRCKSGAAMLHTRKIRMLSCKSVSVNRIYSAITYINMVHIIWVSFCRTGKRHNGAVFLYYIRTGSFKHYNSNRLIIAGTGIWNLKYWTCWISSEHHGKVWNRTGARPRWTGSLKRDSRTKSVILVAVLRDWVDYQPLLSPSGLERKFFKGGIYETDSTLSCKHTS